ncbi:MAG: hypothetical protein QXT26_00935, partial [Thermoproteota archaeon]
MSGVSAIVWSREDALKVSEFLKRVAPDFADGAQAIVETDHGDTVHLRVDFFKKDKTIRTVRVVAVRDKSGNIIRIRPAEVAGHREEYSKSSKFLSLETLEDRLRILNWHYSNSLSTIAKRLVGLEVFSILPFPGVQEANKVFNNVFYEAPLTLFPYGYFDKRTGEYVITRPDTPTPWINYIGQGGYGGIVSNTGGGYSFDRDP